MLSNDKFDQYLYIKSPLNCILDLQILLSNLVLLIIDIFVVGNVQWASCLFSGLHLKSAVSTALEL